MRFLSRTTPSRSGSVLQLCKKVAVNQDARLESPLRYPGGKASLSPILQSIIEKNKLDGCAYYEPYVGGGGAALSLLGNRIVSELFLNDADRRIYCFWQSILNETDRFIDRVQKVSLTIPEWRKQKAICTSPRGHSRFDIGFATFYLNRCNRSGVLDRAGPIGGYDQTGDWKIDVRFPRESLGRRIQRIGGLRDRIHISNQDAIRFLAHKIPLGKRRGEVFVYLDPPYLGNGKRLYLNYYTEADHVSLARYLKTQKTLRWLMSYDDSAVIRRLYVDFAIRISPITYSLQVKRRSHELIVYSDNLVPSAIPFHFRTPARRS